MANSKKKKNKIIQPDYLTPLVKHAPSAWALIRASEIKATKDVDLISPSLDIGCGDGEVAKVLLQGKKKFDWGIDLSEIEIKKAQKSGVYKNCKIASVYNLPFKDGQFNTVFSNSVVEHLDELDLAISEMSRVLKKGGSFVITVPTPYLTRYLAGKELFDSLGLKFLGNLYGKFFNNLFKHRNLYTHTQWDKMLNKHLLKLKEYKYYHSKKLIQLHELLTFIAIPQQISKILFNNWVISKSIRNNIVLPLLLPKLQTWYLEDKIIDRGGSLLLVATKTSGE